MFSIVCLKNQHFTIACVSNSARLGSDETDAYTHSTSKRYSRFQRRLGSGALRIPEINTINQFTSTSELLLKSPFPGWRRILPSVTVENGEGTVRFPPVCYNFRLAMWHLVFFESVRATTARQIRLFIPLATFGTKAHQSNIGSRPHDTREGWTTKPTTQAEPGHCQE